MNPIIKLLLLLSMFTYWCCGADTEKYQNKRNTVVNVQDKIIKIMNDVIVNKYVTLDLTKDYLFVTDFMARDTMIKIFDKRTFKHLASTATFGEGPGEITVIGQLAMNKTDREFYVSDHGKRLIYRFELDSVLANPSYLPKVKTSLKDKVLPLNYIYINDTYSIAKVGEPIGHNDFQTIIAKWNMNTGEIEPINYEHPKVPKKRIIFTASEEQGLYVECYTKRDLMTICDLEGNLKYNVYGPNWGSDVPTSHYEGVVFCKNKILALYSGSNWYSRENATKFFVFDLNGNYIKTLEVGYQINNCCYDGDNERIILSLNEDFQFAYLDLEGLLD